MKYQLFSQFRQIVYMAKNWIIFKFRIFKRSISTKFHLTSSKKINRYLLRNNLGKQNLNFTNHKDFYSIRKIQSKAINKK
jgi:hypothetical protein